MSEGRDCGWVLPPLPPVPEELLTIPAEVLAEWDADGAACWEESLLHLSPAERFRLEHGVDPSPRLLAGEASQDAAAHAQDVAVQANRVRDLADARRIATADPATGDTWRACSAVHLRASAACGAVKRDG